MSWVERITRAFVRRVEGWGRAPGREGIIDARSAGPCPRCGHERLRIRDVRVDDLGYSVRVRDRWGCGCDDDRDPADRKATGVV